VTTKEELDFHIAEAEKRLAELKKQRDAATGTACVLYVPTTWVKAHKTGCYTGCISPAGDYCVHYHEHTASEIGAVPASRHEIIFDIEKMVQAALAADAAIPRSAFAGPRGRRACNAALKAAGVPEQALR
jgi:hypothetical protein